MTVSKYQVFDRLIEGAQVIDPQWRYVYVNDAVAGQAKVSKDSLIGRTMMEKFPGIEKTEMFRDLRKCMEKRIPSQVSNEFTFPDGSRGWFELSMQPVPEGVLILSFDVSQLKKTESELAEKLTERTRMFRQIEEQKKQLEEFCYIIAHNLRAPLSNLLLLNDMVYQSSRLEDKLMLLERQKPVIDFLLEIFEELVDATQIKVDHSVKSDPVDLAQCTGKALQLLQGDILASDALITSDFSKAQVVHFPLKYMDSIMFNLLSNALKYRSPERRPEIYISSYLKNGCTYIDIKDNGLGIDLEKHGNKLFRLRKTFHQHPNAKGLGLFMTKTQIEAMGGKIEVKSTPGKGSTFTIKLYKNKEL